MQPWVSVIIVCRNPGPAVSRALRSAWDQKGGDLEVVVVDGASTDGTREWLMSVRNRIHRLISEPDGGVYDAMNKGVLAASGEWLLFLGADDQLAREDVLARARLEIAGQEEAVFSGEAQYTDGRIYRFTAAPAVARRNFLHHQATLYRRDLLERFRFDIGLRIQGDYDLNLRLWHADIRPRPINLVVSLCSPGGLSDSGKWQNYREEIRVRHRHLPVLHCLLWDAGSVLRWLRKASLRVLRRD